MNLDSGKQESCFLLLWGACPPEMTTQFIANGNYYCELGLHLGIQGSKCHPEHL